MSINYDEIKEITPSIHESKLIAPKNENTPYPQSRAPKMKILHTLKSINWDIQT
jgi:hypothetical protein